jgi:NADH dehydrogenase
MMPGIKRQLRLVVDWTVDLLFERDTSELGQLGHPPALEIPGNGSQAGTAPDAQQTVSR